MIALALPPLREELSLHAGPVDGDGSPTWILRDPVRNRFFRLRWAAFEILARWVAGPIDEVVKQVNAETPLSIGSGEVMELAEFLALNQLVRVDNPQGTARLKRFHDRETPPWHTWLLHHYLFFRIPLVRPDRILTAVLPYVAWLGGLRFRLLTLVALLIGLGLLIRQWDRFAAAFSDVFNWHGAVAFGAALALAKLSHELSHAFTAKRLGCRIGSMGLAFLVMWPVLYTDVNDAWLLPRRRDRLAVGAAGVLAELTLAAWATLAWGFLPDGSLRQAALALATTTWISSLVLNLSPFMRFDGYFLVMDALDTPNLHARSFALARWALREALFGLGEPEPEVFPPARRRFLIAFAWATWIYRLLVFLAIAALVYHVFFKLLGILLFGVEIGWFLAMPVWREAAEWRRRGSTLWAGWRGKITFGLATLGILLTCLPLPARVSAPALFQASLHEPLYSPVPSVLNAVLVSDGQNVTPGTPLFRLSSPDLEYRRIQAALRVATVTRELDAVGFDLSLQQETQALRQELLAAEAERRAVKSELARLTVTASVEGRIADLEPALTPGQWISPKTQLGTVVAAGPGIVVAYVGEDEVSRIEEGAKGRFFATAPGKESVAVTVEAVERTALAHLDAPALASVAHGPIAIRMGDRSLTPEAALYRVRLSTPEPAPEMETRGTVHIAASSASLLGHLWRSAAGVLLRESGM